MPRQQQPGPIFRAKDSFAFTDPGGGLRVIHKGELLASNDYAVKVHRELVEPVTAAVEAATHGPGEVRSVSIPLEENIDAPSSAG